jgi:hypothetical protein
MRREPQAILFVSNRFCVLVACVRSEPQLDANALKLLDFAIMSMDLQEML